MVVNLINGGLFREEDDYEIRGVEFVFEDKKLKLKIELIIKYLYIILIFNDNNRKFIK